jgi:hypothetical protein
MPRGVIGEADPGNALDAVVPSLGFPPMRLIRNTVAAQQPDSNAA